jgi:hypothetical protein
MSESPRPTSEVSRPALCARKCPYGAYPGASPAPKTAHLQGCSNPVCASLVGHVLDARGALVTGTAEYLVHANNLPRGALILAIVGALTIIVFWLGIPVVLAGAAALLALEVRRRAMPSTSASAALLIAVLLIAAAVVLAFVG